MVHLALAAVVLAFVAAVPSQAREVRLSGSVSPVLARSTPDVAGAPRTLTLTVVLRRRDQRGFDRFLKAVQDPRSPRYRHFESQAQLTRRFGPSSRAYATVLAFLRRGGLKLLQGSANRLTLTVAGTRLQAERLFGVRIGGFRSMSGKRFYANDQGPALPAAIAPDIQAVIGLSSLDQPLIPSPVDQSAPPQDPPLLTWGPCSLTLKQLIQLGNPCSDILADACWEIIKNPKKLADERGTAGIKCAAGELNLIAKYVSSLKPARRISHRGGASALPAALIGTGQKIGLLEFANYHPSDVSDYLAFAGLDPSQINNLSEKDVAGGAGPPVGAGETEALLDIAAALTLAPGAHVVVYDAPFSGGASFQTMFNAMIGDGDTVISNSWSACEDQASVADVQSIDQLLAGAAASGISVINGSGDSGATCLDGSPNTIGVPADSPHATAVGGTSATPGPGGTYGAEHYWSGGADNPPTGQGGFGVSRFFPVPSYQNGFTAASGRSIPDVALNSDPAHGYVLCQADNGGCPDGQLHGGTSVAAPMMAAFVADLSTTVGHRLGELNPLLYPHAGAFHSGAGMGSNFAHVGLGSPNLDVLSLALSGASAGPVDQASSDLSGIPVTGVSGDGTTHDTLVATLNDANGNSVAGKHVTLAASAGTHSTIANPTGVSTTDNGTVTFKVSDTVPETVTYTATETDDGVTLSSFQVNFVTPSAAAAGISANPTTVVADNTSTSQITVTLHDANDNPVSGKQVTLAPGGGTHSTINGPSPLTTDANGQAKFTVSDSVAESVTYSATDVTDGSLPFPGTVTVQFTNQPNSTNCFKNGPPTPATGFAATSYVTGFPLDIYNWGCLAPIGEAFDASGNLYVVDVPNQVLYRFPPGGGVAGALTEVGPLPTNAQDNNGGVIAGIAFGPDGSLYATTQGGFEGSGGEVIQISPTTGAFVRTVVPYNGFGSTDCATGIAPDPISGDLFITEPRCTLLGGEGYVNRISGPTSASPPLSHYATPGPSDGITIAADGTIFVAHEGGIVDKISPTTGTQPATFTQVAHVLDSSMQNAPIDGIAVGEDPGSTHAAFLYVNRNDGIITKLDLSTDPPTQTDIFSGGSRGDFVTVGPDGCLYATQTDSILKLTNADGSCSLSSTAVAPQLGLAPTTVSPPPTQGGSQTLTATLSNTAPLSGVPVTFTVTGANSQTAIAHTDANGQARFTYEGVQSGEDRIVASATGGSTPVSSTQSTIDWTPGPHTTALDLNLAPTGGPIQTKATITAVLDDVTASPIAAIPGATVKLSLGGQSCMATTDATGRATCTVLPTASPGYQPLTATFAGTSGLAPSSASQTFLLSSELQSVLTYAGATSATDGATAAVSGQLTLANGGALAGKPVTFTLGSGSTAQSCSANTDATGAAGCTIASVNQSAGAVPMQAEFPGDSTDAAAFANATVNVIVASTQLQSVLTYTGARSATNGGTAAVSGQLTLANGGALAGKPVTFTLGSGGASQTCSATTDAGGTAGCTIASVNQPAGAVPVQAKFPGDGTDAAAFANATINVAAARAGVPVNTVPPAASGTPKAGQMLSCSTGAWSNSPTRFAYQWSRDGTPIAGASTQTYTVQTGNEGLTLTCTVAASNAAGSGSPATSHGVAVPVPFVRRCPRATGQLHGRTLGLARLGMTRRQARKAFTHSSNRGKRFEDFFCLTPIGVRVGYASDRLRKTLSPGERKRVRGRVVLALTANGFYALRGVRPGATLAVAARTLRTGAPFHIGVNFWYMARNGTSTAVLKVRHGIVQEVGIADARLTHSKKAQRAFITSFS